MTAVTVRIMDRAVRDVPLFQIFRFFSTLFKRGRAGGVIPTLKKKFLEDVRLARGAKSQNFPGSNFLRAKSFQTKCVKLFLTTSLKSGLLPLRTLPKNA